MKKFLIHTLIWQGIAHGALIFVLLIHIMIKLTFILFP